MEGRLACGTLGYPGGRGNGTRLQEWEANVWASAFPRESTWPRSCRHLDFKTDCPNRVPGAGLSSPKTCRPRSYVSALCRVGGVHVALPHSPHRKRHRISSVYTRTQLVALEGSDRLERGLMGARRWRTRDARIAACFSSGRARNRTPTGCRTAWPLDDHGFCEDWDPIFARVS